MLLEGILVALIQTLVSLAAEEAKKGIGTFLRDKLPQLRDLYLEFDEIKGELQSMQSFLRDEAEAKARTEIMATWVTQVREAAHKVEDIIDEFKYCMHGRGRARFRGTVHDIVYFPKDMKAWRDIATQLKQIKKEILEISKRKDRYIIDRPGEGSSSSRGNESHRPHEEFPLNTEGSDIVGIKENEDLLVQWLMDEKPQRTDDPRHMVISVWGMGGLGKTTLIRRVYEKKNVKKHFHCYAWVSVSQSYTVEELLRSMVKQVYEPKENTPGDIETWAKEKLVTKLQECLCRKRYVIIFDDVWNKDLCDDIIAWFYNIPSGSRIMLTTRDHDVASYVAIGSRIMHLAPLQEQEAWSLFCRKAFWKNNNSCPSELEYWARKIVEKCEGLPLAIAAVGSLLSLKDPIPLRWSHFYDSFHSQLNENEKLNRMKGILMRSFNDLPYHLKQCFLYCSIFPEDYLIKRKWLLRLWAAEGFIKERLGMTLEEVAEDYLRELIFRSMLQVVETNESRRMKTLRVHDLMREIALSISAGENFYTLYEGQGFSKCSTARRLSIHKNIERNQPNNMNFRNVRSLLVFVNDLS